MATKFRIEPATDIKPRKVLVQTAHAYLTPTEVAYILNTSVKVLRQWRKKNINIAYEDFERTARYPVEAINEYLELRFHARQSLKN